MRLLFKEIYEISNLVAIMQLKTRCKNITKYDANCDFLWYNNSLGIQILQGVI